LGFHSPENGVSQYSLKKDQFFAFLKRRALKTMRGVIALKNRHFLDISVTFQILKQFALKYNPNINYY